MAANERPESVSEETTPLLGSPPDEEEDSPRVRVTRLRGSAIMTAMGLLLFIMSMKAGR